MTFKSQAELDAYKREQAKKHPEYGVIVKALTILSSHNIDLTNYDIRLLDRRPPNTSAKSAAYVFTSEPKIIYVGTFSNEFTGAKNGNRAAMIALAGQLAHEAEHVKGKGEFDAYKQQIVVLKKLGAANSVIQDVAAACKLVTGKSPF